MKQIRVIEVRNIVNVEIPNQSKVTSTMLFQIMKNALGVDGGQILGFYSPVQSTMKSPSSLFANASYIYLAFVAIEGDKKLFGLNFKTWKIGEIFDWQEVKQIVKDKNSYVLYNRGTGMSFDLDTKQMNNLRNERAGIRPEIIPPKPLTPPQTVAQTPVIKNTSGKLSKVELMQKARAQKRYARRSPQQRVKDFSIFRVGILGAPLVQDIKYDKPESLNDKTLHEVVQKLIKQDGGKALGFFKTYPKNTLKVPDIFLDAQFLFLSMFYIKNKERIYAINFKTWQRAELKWCKVRGTPTCYTIIQHDAPISFERKVPEKVTEVIEDTVQEETQSNTADQQLPVSENVEEAIKPQATENASPCLGGLISEYFQNLGYSDIMLAEAKVSFINTDNALLYEAKSNSGDKVYLVYVATQNKTYEVKKID